MGISVEIDKFTPCLIEKETGAIVTTEYKKATLAELKDMQSQGWNFDWTAEHLKDADVYKLTIDGDATPQGLIAITNFKKDRAMYVNLAENAPHNIGESKKYEGVGGHLFAIAANESVKRGNGGFLFLDAKNTQLVEYYTEKFGAVLYGMPHPYRMVIDEAAAKKLLDIYTFKGGE